MISWQERVRACVEAVAAVVDAGAAGGRPVSVDNARRLFLLRWHSEPLAARDVRRGREVGVRTVVAFCRRRQAERRGRGGNGRQAV